MPYCSGISEQKLLVLVNESLIARWMRTEQTQLKFTNFGISSCRLAGVTMQSGWVIYFILVFIITFMKQCLLHNNSSRSLQGLSRGEGEDSKAKSKLQAIKYMKSVRDQNLLL